MAAHGKTPVTDRPRKPLTWPDALILAGALFGILMGVSLLSFKFAVAVGVVIHAYVIVKLVTT